MRPMVIFTDLDGTLLDHESYSFRMALPALDLLRRRKVAVVPVSSKTASEIRMWMRQLHVEGPFVLENGGGIVIPSGYFPFDVDGEAGGRGELRISLGLGIEEVRRALAEIAGELGVAVRGFGDMSPKEISNLTGLKGLELSFSMTREYDEPFLIEGGYDIDLLVEAAARRGFRLIHGGRFYHLAGGCDKGKAIGILADLFRRMDPHVTLVGLGDSPVDLSLFEAVDRPFVVQKRDGTYDPDIPEDAAERVNGIGPQGWRMAIEALFAGDGVNGKGQV